MNDATAIRAGDMVTFHGEVTFVGPNEGELTVRLPGGSTAFIKAAECADIRHRFQVGDEIEATGGDHIMKSATVIAVTQAKKWLVVAGATKNDAPIVIRAEHARRRPQRHLASSRVDNHA